MHFSPSNLGNFTFCTLVIDDVHLVAAWLSGGDTARSLLLSSGGGPEELGGALWRLAWELTDGVSFSVAGLENCAYG